MSDKFTIKIPRDDGERHNERRKDLGLTWAEYIDGEAPFAGEGRILSDDEVAELVEEFAVAVEPEQGMVDDSKMAREVAAKIDYVELAGKVADELEGRMR